MIKSMMFTKFTCMECGFTWNVSFIENNPYMECPKCKDSDKVYKTKDPLEFYKAPMYETKPINYIHPNCVNCSAHPSNGGSGVCHCTMGNNVTYN